MVLPVSYACLLIWRMTTLGKVMASNDHEHFQPSHNTDLPISTDRITVWVDHPINISLVEDNIENNVNISNSNYNIVRAQHDRRGGASAQLVWSCVDLGIYSLAIPIYPRGSDRMDPNESRSWLELIKVVANLNTKISTENTQITGNKYFKVWLLIEFENQTHFSSVDVFRKYETTLMTLLQKITFKANSIYPGTVTGILANFSNVASVSSQRNLQMIIKRFTKGLNTFEIPPPHQLQLGIILGGEDEEDWCGNTKKLNSLSWIQAMSDADDVDLTFFRVYGLEILNRGAISRNICQFQNNLTKENGKSIRTGVVLEIRNESTVTMTTKVLSTLLILAQSSEENGLLILKGADLPGLRKVLQMRNTTTAVKGIPTAEARRGIPIFLFFFFDENGDFMWLVFLGFLGVSVAICCCAFCKSSAEEEGERDDISLQGEDTALRQNRVAEDHV